MFGRIAVVAALFGGLAGSCAVPPDATARFDFVEYRALGEPDETAAGEYRNPVLPGFHPDPSLVRVGEDFYLVTSTFAWFPGLPVFHSRDLVNWRLLGHAIDRPGQVDLSGLGTSRGLFAPAITHHERRFWILNTCVDCRGNFVITADDPAGPWSDPVWLDFDGIDPSLFFHEDGSAWIVYNDAPAAAPRYEGHRALWLQQFDPQAMELMGERTLLVDGGVDPSANPIWAEGPHIYKVGDWYYLLAAEGGTADQHSQTIYRSAAVTGPYMPGPMNPILTQRDLPHDRPDRVEATGHADIVQLADGSWWGTFLATRPFAGQSTLMGRETYLLPVRWQDGWPRFLDPGEGVPPIVTRPALAEFAGTDWRQWRDEFEGEELHREWIGLRTPGPWQQQVVLDGARGELLVTGGPDAAGSLGNPSFAGIRLRHRDAQLVTRLDFTPRGGGSFAGLLAFMDETHFMAFGIEGNGNGRDLVVRLRTSEDQSEQGEIIARAPIAVAGEVELRVQIQGGEAALAWRPAGSQDWNDAWPALDVEPLASIHAELFTGLVIGPYAVAGQERE